MPLFPRPYAFSLPPPDRDYRSDPAPKLSFIDTPDAVKQKSITLAKTLGFDYCALDFRANAAGDWVFLEVNSMPMFVAFDNACENRLVDAQLDLLIGLNQP